MKEIVLVVAAFLVSVVGLLGAAFLAYHDKPGWGWMLLVTLLIVWSVKVSVKD